MRLIRSLTAIVVASVILASSATHAAADRKKSFSGGSGKGRSSSTSRNFGKSSGFLIRQQQIPKIDVVWILRRQQIQEWLFIDRQAIVAIDRVNTVAQP
jgi:hypothetical protein